MHSGTRISLTDFRPENVNLADIAYHLAREPRWCNATIKPVSVLEHVLYCDDLLLLDRSQEIWAPGEFERGRVLVLTHDIEEAYTGDPPANLKEAVPELGRFMDNLREITLSALGIPLPSSAEWAFIKSYDRKSALYEAMYLMRTGDAYADCRRAWGMQAPTLPMNRRVPESAEAEWLKRLKELGVEGAAE